MMVLVVVVVVAPQTIGSDTLRITTKLSTHELWVGKMLQGAGVCEANRIKEPDNIMRNRK